MDIGALSNQSQWLALWVFGLKENSHPGKLALIQHTLAVIVWFHRKSICSCFNWWITCVQDFRCLYCCLLFHQSHSVISWLICLLSPFFLSKLHQCHINRARLRARKNYDKTVGFVCLSQFILFNTLKISLCLNIIIFVWYSNVAE